MGDQTGTDLLSAADLAVQGCRGIVLCRQMIAYRQEFSALRTLCDERGMKLWTAGGADLSAVLDRADAQQQNCFAQTQAGLQAQIDACDTVSFDIFDTLLQRCTLTPDDVFRMVERQALAQGLPGKDFPACRRAAQLDSGLDNPDLEEIYQIYQTRFHLAPDQAQALRDLEVQVESQVLEGRAEMKQVFRYALEQGKRVILTSDMYLPAAVLEPILRREGFDGYHALLISCQEKCLKLDGLFEVLKQKAVGRVLHIGDHRVHDGICADLAGIHYCLLPSQALCLQRCGLQEMTEHLHSDNERALLGLGAARAFSSPFASHWEGTRFCPDACQLSALYFAPLVAAFLHWLAQDLATSPCDGILFAARDGAPMLAWYRAYREAFPARVLPEGTYFYTSRRAASLCVVDDEAVINAIIDSSRALKPDEMLRQKFGLAPEEIQPYTAQDEEEIYQYVWRHQEAIFRHARLARQGYFRYMGSLGLHIGGNYAFYDFVSSGTSQKGLARFAPFTLQGLYFACAEGSGADQPPIRSFLGSDAAFFQRQFKRLELFMTSDEGSLTTLDEEGIPLLAPDHRTPAVMEYIHTCQQEITEWLQRYFSILYQPEQPFAAQAAVALFDAMAQADLHKFDALELSDDWNGSGKTLADSCETAPLRRTQAVQEELPEREWRNFCETTPMRSSLLNWYGFQPHSTVVLIGNSPLVELLCRHCARVIVLEKSPLRGEKLSSLAQTYHNLTLQVGRFPTERPEVSADLVIIPHLHGQDRGKVLATVQAARSLLAPGGRLLAVVQNRFGLKYFCGVPAGKGQLPFAGLEDDSLYSRAGVQSLLEEAGLPAVKFYYPMPDARLPQAIYTDAYQPSDGLRDRVIPYYDSTSTLVAAEDKLWDEVLRNGMLPFFANDFLVEAHDGSGSFDDTVFAALSTDRGARDGFVTAIHGDRTVTKTPIAPEGCETLQRLCATQQALQQRGVQTVPCTYADGRITMPFVQGKNLVSLLSQLAHNRQREDFVALLEGLWRQILASSPQVGAEDCKMPILPALRTQVGTVLEKACIDMIPFNCFYTEGAYLFYDQEFVQENYPASYVMFRALRYTYSFAPEAEAMLPLAEMRQRYGLSDALWSAYESEEARFVEANRNYKEYAPFYRHVGVGTDCLAANRARLQDQGHSLPACRDKAAERTVLLRLLQTFDEVCRLHDLRYTLFYGTLLGAVRHQGFVPWDDDVDVVMPRADYERLCALPADAWPAELFLQTPESDPGCFYGGYAKLRDDATTGIESRNLGHTCHQGIWMDVLPLDACWRDPTRRRDQMKRIHQLQKMLLAKIYPDRYQLDNRTALLCAQTTHGDLCAQLHAALTECDEADAPLTILARYRSLESHILTEEADWQWTIPQPFEDGRYPIPMAYDKLLRQLYGEEYRLYPPRAQRVSHHKGFFDAFTPYQQYQAEHAALLSFFANL